MDVTTGHPDFQFGTPTCDLPKCIDSLTHLGSSCLRLPAFGKRMAPMGSTADVLPKVLDFVPLDLHLISQLRAVNKGTTGAYVVEREHQAIEGLLESRICPCLSSAQSK